MNKLPQLEVLTDSFFIAKVEKNYPFQHLDLFATIYEKDVISLIGRHIQPPPELIELSSDWRALRVAAVLDFAQTGVLARVSKALAEADISVLVISSFDTDYIFVKQDRLEMACAALSDAGYQFLQTSELP